MIIWLLELSYVISVAASRTLEIVIGRRFYSTGESGLKSYAIMGIATVMSIAALFATRFVFDLITAVVLIVLSFLLKMALIQGTLLYCYSRTLTFFPYILVFFPKMVYNNQSGRLRSD